MGWCKIGYSKLNDNACEVFAGSHMCLGLFLLFSNQQVYTFYHKIKKSNFKNPSYVTIIDRQQRSQSSTSSYVCDLTNFVGGPCYQQVKGALPEK